MSGQFAGNGCKILVGDGGSPEVFTSIGNLIDYDGPSGEVPQLLVSNGDSAAVERVAGLVDNGEFGCNMHMNNSTGPSSEQQALFTDQPAGTTRNYRAQFGALTTPNATFAAFVQRNRPTGGVDTPVQIAVTFAISGAVTWAWS